MTLHESTPQPDDDPILDQAEDIVEEWGSHFPNHRFLLSEQGDAFLAVTPREVVALVANVIRNEHVQD